MVTTAPASLKSRKPRDAGRGWLGYTGLGWALSFIPVHVYWALGGLTPSIGITASHQSFRAASWGASLVILGGGLTCLSLVQRWGELLPRALRHGSAWVGGAFGIVHAVAFSAVAALYLSGTVGYPAGTGLTVGQMRGYDWANLLCLEPWFGIMGLLLIGCSLQARRRARSAAAGDGHAGAGHGDNGPAGHGLAAPAWMRQAGWARPAALAMLGLAALANLAWASGSGVLVLARSGHTGSRLIDLGQVGPFRPAAAVAAAALAALAVAVARRRPAGWRRGATALTLAGIFAVVWGVFTFDTWTFAGYGPALMATGLLALLADIAAHATEHT